MSKRVKEKTSVNLIAEYMKLSTRVGRLRQTNDRHRLRTVGAQMDKILVQLSTEGVHELVQAQVDANPDQDIDRLTEFLFKKQINLFKEKKKNPPFMHNVTSVAVEHCVES